MTKPRTVNMKDGDVLHIVVNGYLVLRVGKPKDRNLLMLDANAEHMGVWWHESAAKTIDEMLEGKP